MERESYEYDGVVGHRVVEMPDAYRLETIFITDGHVYILESETVRPKEVRG